MIDGASTEIGPDRDGSAPFGPANGSVTVVELTGDETSEQLKDMAWQMMCNAHPVEAHAFDPERFWRYFHSRAPHMTREQMVALLKECEEPEDESPND